MEKITLNVEGMSCEHCLKAVNNALDGIAGVADIVVSLKDKTVSLSRDPAQAPLDTIKAAITDAGYEVAGQR
ncbi:MAG: copper ion binding protein [Treponema sp.]|jgi:copper chaperone|nr:copper ion binding protein [Treponema sp.]